MLLLLTTHLTRLALSRLLKRHTGIEPVDQPHLGHTRTQGVTMARRILRGSAQADVRKPGNR